MTLTIYGQAASRASRVIWLAKELGLQFEHVPLNQRAGDTRTPDFLKINPNGHIPAIRDGDLVMCESLAINEYLVHKHGGPLAPKTNEDWGRFYMWTMWAMTEIEPQAGLVFQHTVALPEDKRNPQLAASGREALKAPLTVLDRALGKSAYLLGNEFTVADLNVACTLSNVPRFKYDLSPWPNVAAWLPKCTGRPAAQMS
jgi:glutathione S-transferase